MENNQIIRRKIWYRIRDNEKNCFRKPTYEAYKWNLEELTLTQDWRLMMRTMKGIAHESTFPDRFVVMRYSWFTDSNWKEIYEWDILSVNLEDEKNPIVWRLSAGNFFCLDRLITNQWIEYNLQNEKIITVKIIWNTRENKNLLLPS